jgi:hypothetical protein
VKAPLGAERHQGRTSSFDTGALVKPQLRREAERGLLGALSDQALWDHGHVLGSHELSGAGESPADARLSLWCAPLDVSTTSLKRLAVCLSLEERQRAERLRRSLDRERFVAAKWRPNLGLRGLTELHVVAS